MMTIERNATWPNIILEHVSEIPLHVQIGYVVIIMDIKDKFTETHTIVEQYDNDPYSGQLGIDTPLAHALMGKTQGDVATVSCQETYQVQIISIIDPLSSPENSELLTEVF